MSMASRRSSLLNIDEWLDKCSNSEPDSLIYDPEYPNDVATMRAKGQLPDLENLYRIIVDNCTKIGLTPDMIDQRINDLEECISTFIKSIDQDLQDEYNKLCQYKQTLLDQVQKMLTDLYLEPYVPDENLTLLQSCKRLKCKFNELNLVKQKRMTQLQELRDIQTRHCLVLGIKAPQLKMQTDIPTEEELAKLAEAVKELDKEEKRRREKYAITKDLILKCVNELEYEPEDDFEKNIKTQIPDFTESHLLKMTSLLAKLEAKITINKQKYEKLKETLTSLYDRLDVPAHEREEFFATHELCKPSCMIEMELEIEKYEELKRQNIGKFIQKIKEELVLEYEKCFVSQEQQDAFFSLSTISGECNEELLELCERELERIKKYFADNKDILEKFQEWRRLWKQLIDFELKTSDPNRFYNRNCKLLEEEKERKKLQRNLPKVEKDLKSLNDKYSQSNGGNKFKVFDTDLDEFMAGCWDELNHAKEEEKKERQRAKLMKSTPAKRPPPPANKSMSSKVRLQSATKSTPKPTFRAGSQKNIANSNGSMTSALSLSEPEFENMIINCPSSKRTYQ